MLYFERADLNTMDWGKELETFPDHTVFQTPEWLEFLTSTQNGEPVIAALKDSARTVGYFTGSIVRKFGLRILGSPFVGWTTAYMGFNLREGISRRDALHALVRFAFRDLNCVHLELMDQKLRQEDVAGMNPRCRQFTGFEVDLTQSEQTLLRNMGDNCRWCLGKAKKCGVVIEEAQDMQFADDYHAQLTDVFERQQLIPTYGIERVRALIRHILPTGMLLLLRARNPEGDCIATGIFLIKNDRMYFWGGPSWRKYHHLRPNEPLMWAAMQYGKAHGARILDLGGAGHYKKKYGGCPVAVPWLRISRFAIVPSLRDAAAELFRTKQHLQGKLRAAFSSTLLWRDSHFFIRT